MQGECGGGFDTSAVGVLVRYIGVARHSSVQGVVEDSAAGLSLKTKTSTFLLFHRVWVHLYTTGQEKN